MVTPATRPAATATRVDPPRRAARPPTPGAGSDRGRCHELAVAKSIRVFYGKEHGLVGRSRLDFKWGIHPPITPLSIVHVSAAEATEYGTAYVIGPNGNPQQEFIFSLGDADVWVSNVSPHTGGVAFILHVNAPGPVAVVVTITVEEGAPAQFRAP